MRLPAKWIIGTVGALTGLALLTCVLSPSLRHAFIAGWEVRELLRFRDRFKPENLELSCENDPPHRAVACIYRSIQEENRLRYASLTARIYYLSTIVNASHFCRGVANTAPDQIDARLDLLEYLNDEMKTVLLKTGGVVDLSPLDSRSTKFGLVEDPEVSLRRRYFANLVDLWVKYWRQDQRYLLTHRAQADIRTQGRLDMMIGDRDELFSRFSIDLSRYARRRQTMNFDLDDPAAIIIENEKAAAAAPAQRNLASDSDPAQYTPSETHFEPTDSNTEDPDVEPPMDTPTPPVAPPTNEPVTYPWAEPTDTP